MTSGERARRAWARLLEVPALEGVQVVVDDAPVFGRAGWISFLVVDGAGVVAVPVDDLVRPVQRVAASVAATALVDPGVVRLALEAEGVVTVDVLGPAQLLYPEGPVAAGSGDVADRAEVERLAAVVPDDDLRETGILELDSPPFASRDEDSGAVAAVCGYRRWPNGVAHLAVLTHPDHRRRGHGRRAAASAVAHAVEAGLLPQWRARRAPSVALARRLGFDPAGGQLGLEPGASR